MSCVLQSHLGTSALRSPLCHIYSRWHNGAVHDHSARCPLVPPGAILPSLQTPAKPGSVYLVPGTAVAPKLIQGVRCGCCHRLVLKARRRVPGEGGCHVPLGSGCMRMTRGRHEHLKPQYSCLKTMEIATGSESTTTLISGKWPSYYNKFILYVHSCSLLPCLVHCHHCDCRFRESIIQEGKQCYLVYEFLSVLANTEHSDLGPANCLNVCWSSGSPFLLIRHSQAQN